MKTNPLFEECSKNVSPEIREEVRLNIEIANRIDDLLKFKGMTQRELAKMMGKRESEVSRWLSGAHGFTTATLAKISAVLGEPIVEVPRIQEPVYVFCTPGSFVSPTEFGDGDYTGSTHNQASFGYSC